MRIVDRAGVLIEPDDRGFAGKLRRDLSKDLDEATRGLDKTIKVKIEADARAAEKNLRAALAEVEQAQGRVLKAEQGLERQRQRSEKATAAEEAAELKLSAAKTRAESATARLEAAETKLRDLRETGKATAAQLAAAEDKVRSARAKLSEVSAAVTLAESRLVTARAGTARASRDVGEAETRLAAAHGEVAAATERHTQRESEHAEVLRRVQREASAAEARLRQLGETQTRVASRSRLATTALRVLEAAGSRVGISFRRGGDDGDRFGSRVASAARKALDAVKGLFSSLFAGAGRAANILGKILPGAAGNLSTSLGTTQKAFADLFKEIGESKNVGQAIAVVAAGVLQLGQQIVSAGAAATGLIIAGAGITAAWGAAATAVAAVPAVVGLLAAPIAAVALGLDGIKRAAKTLQPEFDRLKTSVSATFERGLLPAFRQLRAVFPTLTNGLNEVAEALSGVARDVARLVTEGDNLGRLRLIFANVAGAVRDLSPAITDVLDGFLQLASRKSILDGLTGAARTFGREFRESVTRTISDGTLDRAFRGLGGVIDALLHSIVGLVENGLRIFANAAPGVERVIRSLTDFFGKFDYDKLGASVGKVFDGIASAIDKIPPDTIRRIQESFEKLGDAFADPGFQKGLAGFVELLPPIIDGARYLSQGFALAGRAIGIMSEKFSEFNTKAKDTGDQLKEIPRKIEQFFSEIPEKIRQKLDDAQRVISEFPGKAGAALAGLADTVRAKADEAGRSLSERVQRAVDDAQRWLAELPGRAATALGTLAGTIVRESENAWRNLSDTARRKSDEAVGWAQALPGRVQGALAALPGTLSRIANDAWTQFANWARTKGDEATSTARGLPGRIGSALSSLLGIVKGAAERAWEGFRNSTRQKGEETLNYVRQIPGKIRGFFSNAGSLLLQAGRDIAQGLLNGLKQKGEEALNYVKSLGAKIAAGFRSAVQARSPSRVFIQAGLDTLAGLIVGFERSAPSVVARIRDLGARIVAEWASAQARVAAITSRVQAALQVAASGGGTVRVDLAGPSAAASASARPIAAASVAAASVRATTSASSGADQAAALIAELQRQTVELRALRRDVIASGAGPEVVNRLDQLVAASGPAGTDRAAASRGSALRDFSDLGAFP